MRDLGIRSALARRQRWGYKINVGPIEYRRVIEDADSIKPLESSQGPFPAQSAGDGVLRELEVRPAHRHPIDLGGGAARLITGEWLDHFFFSSTSEWKLCRGTDESELTTAGAATVPGKMMAPDFFSYCAAC